jgi:MFS family permease
MLAGTGNEARPPGSAGESAAGAPGTPGDNYKWVALANTTAAVFMSQLDGSIVLIALPAIFRGIHLDPLAPSNISYLLWMLMGYRLVQAVLVVTVGRLGDMFGRVASTTPASWSSRSPRCCCRLIPSGVRTAPTG